MTTDSARDLDERLAELARRRAERSTSAARRAHPAVRGRIAAFGVSTSAFIGLIVSLSANAPASGSALPPRPAATRYEAAPASTDPPRVVVRNVHHRRFVDPHGRPMAAAAVPKNAIVVPQPTSATAAAAPPATGTVPARGAPPAPGGTAASVSAPPAAAPAVVPQPGPTATTPHVTTPVAAPEPTTPPATTPPATTPVTVHIPAPPPPPPCTGSKCP